VNDRAREFLRELRDNWDDHYWWARHQALQAALVAVLIGAIGLAFAWLETRMKIRAAVAVGEAAAA
jgi:hypothetical protein